MEQNKLEKEINEKLNARTIQPSAQAWDRLDAMLTVAEQPKKKFGWLYIAASLVGLMFVSVLFLKNQSNDNEVIVNKNSIENTMKIEEINKIEIAESVEKSTVAEVKPVLKEKRLKKFSNNSKTTEQDEIVVAKEKQEEILNENSIRVENKITANNEKSIALAPTTNYQQPKTIKVDPASLLSQVDGELTLNFREKVIKKYQTVKVALAERNIQK